MSKYIIDPTSTDRYSLNQMGRVGFTEELGKTWWGGGHFAGAVPLEEALALLQFEILELPSLVDAPGSNFAKFKAIEAIMGDATLTADEKMEAIRNITVVEVPNKKAIGRDVEEVGRRVFNVVSKKYTPHDYVEVLVENVMTILDASGNDLMIGSVFVFEDGRQACIQVRPPEGVTVGGDRLLPWLNVFSSLDGSLATTYKAVVTRLQCDNTMMLAWAEDGQVVKIKHTKNSKLALAEARDLLGVTFTHVPEYQQMVEEWMNTTVVDDQFNELVKRLVPIDDDSSKRGTTMAVNKRSQLLELWETDTRVAPYRGTKWGAYNAFNTYDQHLSIVRNIDKDDRHLRNAQNLMDGTTENRDETVLRAIDLILAGK